jgi:hypothetical protein
MQRYILQPSQMLLSSLSVTVYNNVSFLPLHRERRNTKRRLLVKIRFLDFVYRLMS